jgi:hypothetical protein
VDEVDIANDRTFMATEALLSMLYRNVTKIPRGAPGECDHCGETSPRLVLGACARCRDRLDLP